MAARTVRLLKLKCPQCGRESALQVREDSLAAASTSPTGLVGIADYHGDHVLVVYVDGEGRDRGVRVFRALQRGEVIRVNPAYLTYMNVIAGFRVSFGGWSLECFPGSPRTLLRVTRGEPLLEMELRNLERAASSVEWGDSFLAALSRVGQPDPGELLLSILLLDSSIQFPPSPFATRMFEVSLKSRRLVVKVDSGAAELLREYAPRIPWLSTRLVDYAVSVKGWRLVDAVLGPDPLTIRERLLTILSLERRGVVGFEEVGA